MLPFKSSRNIEIGLMFFSYVILALGITCSFSSIDPTQGNPLFTSDAVSLPLIFKDLTQDGGKIKDWYFAAAPTLFPDITLYYFLNMFHAGLNTTLFLYSLMQVFLVTFLCIYIFKRLVPEQLQRYSWMIPLLFTAFFLETFYFSNNQLMSMLLATYSYHAGAFVNALIALCIFLGPRSLVFKSVTLLLFSVLAVFSDMLYIVMLTFPLTITLLLNIEKKTRQLFIYSMIVVSLGSIVGILIYDYVKDSGISNFYKPYKMYAFNNILPSLKLFLKQMKEYIITPGLLGFHVLFTFISLPVAVLLLLLKRKTLKSNAKLLLTFYVVFSMCVLSAPIINGNYTGYDTLRYNVSYFFFSIIPLAALAGFLMELIKKEMIRNIVKPVLPLLFFIMITVKFSAKGFGAFIEYYPPDVSQLDSACARYNLKYGVAGYWTAKHTTAFSREGLKIMAVHGNGNIYELGSNMRWYNENEFDFIIANDMEVDCSKIFKIKDSVNTKDFKIYIVEKFNYPKGTYSPVTK